MRRWRASPMLMPRLGSRATKRPDVGGRIIIECQYIARHIPLTDDQN
jgi:hypothetical protein